MSLSVLSDGRFGQVRCTVSSTLLCQGRASLSHVHVALIDCLAGRAGGGAEQRRVGQHARQDSNIQLLLRGRDDN